MGETFEYLWVMQVDIAGKAKLDENCRKVSISGRRRKPQVIRCLSMCTVENFKNHPGLHRVRVCHWSAVDVFCSWFYERGLVLDTSQVHVVSDYLSLFIALLFWILRLFFFPWRRCELSNLRIVCRIYRCFQVSRYQVSWYVNQPRGLTAWCANIPLSVV